MGNADRKKTGGLRPLGKKLAPKLIHLLAHTLIPTYRVSLTAGSEERVVGLLAGNTPVLPCYWHQQTVMCVDFLVGLQKRGLNLAFLVSPSEDGNIGAGIFESLGVRYIRGSSSATGAQSLREIYLAVTRENLSVATTPDGPLGPPFQFKQGWVNLARLTGAPMLPVACAADRYWTLRTWDRLQVPAPFARVVVSVGEAVHADKQLDELGMEVLQHRMEDELNRLQKVTSHNP